MSKKNVLFGEVLLSLSPPNKLKYLSKVFNVHYGGEGTNTGLSLALMGCNVDLVTALPQKQVGNSVESEMLSYGMKTNIIKQQEEWCFIISNRA